MEERLNMMRKYTNKPAQGPRGRGLMRMDPNQESGQSNASSRDHKTFSIHIEILNTHVQKKNAVRKPT